MEPLSLVAIGVILAAIGYSAWRKAPLSLTFGVAIIVVYGIGYAAELADPTYRLASAYTVELSFWQIGGIHSGLWTYVTSVFMHASLLHLAANLLFLFLLGPLLEDRIGTLRWAILFLLGGAVGSLGFQLLHLGDHFFMVVGASGALSAVFGAFGRLYPRERIQFWVPVPLPPAPAIYYVIGFIAVQALLAVSSLGASTGIAWEAHVIGLAFGFVFAPLVMRVPAKVRARVVVADPAKLEPLATTRELRQILDDLKAADLPEVRAAWLETFTAKAVCPECGGPLRCRRGALVSPCGWRLRL